MSKEVTTWRRITPQEIHVRSSVGWFLRCLGAPFIAFGGYLLYLLVGALGEYALEANAAEWLAATPGFLILTFLALLFFTPGWLLAIVRVRTELDADRGEAREIRDYLFFKTAKRHDLEAFDRVEVGLQEIRYRHRESGNYRTLVSNEISLKGDDQSSLTVGLIDDDAKAVELGQVIAGLFDLELQTSGMAK